MYFYLKIKWHVYVLIRAPYTLRSTQNVRVWRAPVSNHQKNRVKKKRHSSLFSPAPPWCGRFVPRRREKPASSRAWARVVHSVSFNHFQYQLDARRLSFISFGRTDQQHFASGLTNTSQLLRRSIDWERILFRNESERLTWKQKTLAQHWM